MPFSNLTMQSVLKLGALFFVAIQFLTGCATVLVRTSSSSFDVYYPATISDAALFCFAGAGYDSNASCFSKQLLQPSSALLAAGTIIDLPFSLVFDTIFLPYDIYKINYKKKSKPAIQNQRN